jgi:hypothetical protein
MYSPVRPWRKRYTRVWLGPPDNSCDDDASTAGQSSGCTPVDQRFGFAMNSSGRWPSVSQAWLLTNVVGAWVASCAKRTDQTTSWTFSISSRNRSSLARSSSVASGSGDNVKRRRLELSVAMGIHFEPMQ